MDRSLLNSHISSFIEKSTNPTPELFEQQERRKERVLFYQSWTKNKILKMSEDDFLGYLSKLWAMLIWGNKQYYVEKIISDNGFQNVKGSLADLVWSKDKIELRWDRFRNTIKGMGPAIISEILCHVHPKDYIIWNRRAFVGLNYLGLKDLPRYNYQLTGKVYKHLVEIESQIANDLRIAGLKDANLLTVDYFIWEELQVEPKLSQIFTKEPVKVSTKETKTTKSLHNEVRDKLAEIGEWLGFKTYTEKKVAHGSQVDAVWEATIGNMGRVIYVFEVQTSGSTDSLILNLLKATNNPAVQGVVAVSDVEQLDKIKKHVSEVGDLSKKLRYWNYEEILQVHDNLEFVNTVINKLELVPESF